MTVTHDNIETKLREAFGDSILEVLHFRDELTFIISKEFLIGIVEFLRDEPEFAYTFLTDLTATDWPDREQRHEVVYLLYSFDSHTYVRLKVRLKEGEKISSLCGIWDIANWFEREVYDLFGVEFEGHPDLTRILTPDGFEGHPLRKDFPLTYEVPQFTYNIDDPPEVID
ncbi:MAG: NADH-quinone oxidoreductase subunit C [candidate division Zixibacteria bacterium]|nr:NADH-quinone oxidoreductase subunit C [candidate division Zixibacteria bacterium]MBU1471897.1 NADH-quinone oxidoreductase subunit C [candidate division Zixibacteria bacterium]MBU2625593.1 NADH-quinone oxidoreductase subunit C [candidate division Zixibacteria bacterium]